MHDKDSKIPSEQVPFLAPEPDNPALTTQLSGQDATGQPVDLPVVQERAITIYLNSQEIITSMTVGDHVAEMAVGFLFNQHILTAADEIDSIDVDEELDVVVVRTHQETGFEAKTKKKIKTSGCAQGTVFADVMDRFEAAKLPKGTKISAAELTALSKTINHTPSLYLKAGAIHGCVLAKGAEMLLYMEDIGRHNAVDKIAGVMLMNNISGADKIFYTTGRLTSEMVIKTVLMGIPILVSRSGFTEAGVRLARQAGLTLIGRAKGSRFFVLSGPERVEFAAQLEQETTEQQSPQRAMTSAKGQER
ncbi:MAG: formate dehydrogenase accessory sulfurtransferase FdhD [Candidatus Puniceispirillaceae bacterium]